ncbi:MAG: membrane protein insertase YidC [Pseudomonadales bacterium]
MDIQRIVILIGLAVSSYMLVLAWNEDYGNGAVNAQVEQPIVSTSTPQITSDDLPNVTGISDASDLVPTIEADVSISAPQQQLQSNPNIVVNTDVLQLTIDLVGGDIISVALPKYPANLDTPDIPFLLVDPRNSYAAQSGLIGPDGIDKSGNRPLYQAAQSSYELLDSDSLEVDLTFINEANVVIKKRFTFHPSDYLIDVKYIVNNTSYEDMNVALFSQIKRDGQEPVEANTNAMGLRPFVGGATHTTEELYNKLTFEDISEDGYKGKYDGGYIAMVQHYFVSAWVPVGEGSYSYQMRKLSGQDIYFLGFTTPMLNIPPGSIGEIAAKFYVGPKDQYRLEEIAEGLDLTVDYGFLWWLAKPLFYLLTMIHGVFNNWGIAIILLTVVVKTLLFPLSAASFRSMAKMRKLQPEMTRLKEHYGDDKQKFSQAMMDLYKKEGANPLGGCFPMLLQMPVFLALYWTLMESVELRHAPFMLWINDLSVMDPYFVLPILMGGSMFLTQMMQPEPPDPTQAKVMKMMPIMFTFFFLWFPSGLVLYWLVNNILSVLQQWFVTRQVEKAG